MISLPDSLSETEDELLIRSKIRRLSARGPMVVELRSPPLLMEARCEREIANVARVLDPFANGGTIYASLPNQQSTAVVETAVRKFVENQL